MLIASFDSVATHYGAQPVLKGVSFKISAGQKLGLIGPNGAGKTTILRVLLGQEPPTSGSVFVSPGVRIGYVPQHVEYDDGETVLGHILVEYSALAEALQDAETRLERASEAEVDRALRAYQRARDDYDRLDGDLFPQRARAMLD
ncbi:MAG: ATP-binding cassette domain-containing protein, partial [Chloroflexi bacterium]|nr:ATP-binding cassette domain-containing protein [Chloroflexota bacterium]